MAQLITVDGSFGEGGGQILRTSLALSVLTRTPLRLENIRAGREKPGLMRQHLACVRAAAQISAASVDGDSLGSQTLAFNPGPIAAGHYHFAIGSAGSTSLVLQTVLPPLLQAAGASTLTLEGGTHNPLAPPFDFLLRAFLPLLNRMGPAVHATLQRPGFYPAGGGVSHVTITPAPFAPLILKERGAVTRHTVRALIAGLPRHVGERELAAVARRFPDWPADAFAVEVLPESCGPGNVLVAEITAAQVTEVLTAFGQKGLVAEAVADDLVGQIRAYLAHEAPVGQHLADQLLIPMAMAAAAGPSHFVTGPLSLHAQTNSAVIQRFLPVQITVDSLGKNLFRVQVARKS